MYQWVLKKNLENLGNFPKAWAYCKGSEDLAKGETSELKDKSNLQFPNDTSGDITKKSECNNNVNTDKPRAKENEVCWNYNVKQLKI